MLNARPKTAQPGAEAAHAAIWQAEDTRTTPQAAVQAFAAEYATKWPKAATKITDDLDVLLAFYDHSAEHSNTCAPPTRSLRPSPP